MVRSQVASSLDLIYVVYRRYKKTLRMVFTLSQELLSTVLLLFAFLACGLSTVDRDS
jgi:hypothetical protein